MIALRGILECRRQAVATTPDVAVAAADGTAAEGTSNSTATPNDNAISSEVFPSTTRTVDSAKQEEETTTTWVWNGEWYFGSIADEKSIAVNRLPFSYTWVEPLIVGVSQQREAKDQEPTAPPSTAAADTSAVEVSSSVSTANELNEDMSKDPGITESVEPPPAAKTTIQYQGATIPASGKWMGSFDTMTGRKTQQKRKPVPESFVLRWILEPRHQQQQNSQTTTATTDDSSNNKIQLTGRGVNQYGNFEFVGTYDATSGILQCQKSYVLPSESDGGDTGTDTVSNAQSTVRPYQTRKRQMSWKRRAAYDSDDGQHNMSATNDQGDVESRHQHQASSTSPSSIPQQPPLKKQRLMDDSENTTSKSTLDDIPHGNTISSLDPSKEVLPSTLGAAPTASLTVQIPGAGSTAATAPVVAGGGPTSSGKSISPHRNSTSGPSGPQRKRSSSVASTSSKGGGICSGGTAAANTTTTTAPSSAAGGAMPPGSQLMKLPSAGEAHKARWRAAHFLYYHQEDPTSSASTNGTTSTATYLGASTAEGSNSGGTAPSGGGGGGGAATSSPVFIVYEGELLNSQRHGRGVCLYNNGMIYEGEWKRDKEHGIGTLMTSDRKAIIYKGEWERGKMHGAGVYYYNEKNRCNSTNSKNQQQQHQQRRQSMGNAGNCRYEGEFKENFRHGSGTYVLPDGSTYSGQWREGLMCGRGVFTWPDGSIYDGEWKDGKRHGLGLLKSSDGFTYDGAWVHNTMEGRGSATYPNGQQYNGLFSRGRREGRGTILFTNGAVYEGRFRDDAIDGQGTMKMSRTMVVPRHSSSSTGISEEGGSNEDGTTTKQQKDDFMIPVSFQSDMGHIHRKAGFTQSGK